MIKKILFLLLIIQSAFFYSQSIEKEVAVFKKVLSAYIDNTISYRKKESSNIDKENEILIAHWLNVPKGSTHIIGVSFFDTHLLKNTPYTRIFDFKGYKLVLVSNDYKDFELKFGKYFKQRKFEDINKNNRNDDFNWDTRNIGVEFNEKLQVVSFNPETKDLMKDLIANKLTIAKDCTCLSKDLK